MCIIQNPNGILVKLVVHCYNKRSIKYKWFGLDLTTISFGSILIVFALVDNMQHANNNLSHLFVNECVLSAAASIGGLFYVLTVACVWLVIVNMFNVQSSVRVEWDEATTDNNNNRKKAKRTKAKREKYAQLNSLFMIRVRVFLMSFYEILWFFHASCCQLQAPLYAFWLIYFD